MVLPCRAGCKPRQEHARGPGRERPHYCRQGWQAGQQAAAQADRARRSIRAFQLRVVNLFQVLCNGARIGEAVVVVHMTFTDLDSILLDSIF